MVRSARVLDLNLLQDLNQKENCCWRSMANKWCTSCCFGYIASYWEREYCRCQKCFSVQRHFLLDSSGLPSERAVCFSNCTQYLPSAVHRWFFAFPLKWQKFKARKIQFPGWMYDISTWPRNGRFGDKENLSPKPCPKSDHGFCTRPKCCVIHSVQYGEEK